MFEAGARAHEAARLEVVGGAEAVAAQQPARADRALAQQPEPRLQRDGLRHLFLPDLTAHPASWCV